MTIFGSSGDPVLVKKIALKIWSLRDEVEVVLREASEKNGGIPPADLSKIINLYTKNEISNVAPGLTLVPPTSEKNSAEELIPAAAPLDNSEDEMAKALAEANGETVAESTAEDITPDTSQTTENAPISENAKSEESAFEIQQLITVVGDKTVIKQIIPNIPANRIVNGKTLLAEINMDQIFFFCDYNFIRGQSIVLDFQIPKRFIVNAEVIYCRGYNMKSRIISDQKLPYRAVAKFTFLKEGERTLLRNFLESIAVSPQQAAAKSADNSDKGKKDSELGELEDLLS